MNIFEFRSKPGKKAESYDKESNAYEISKQEYEYMKGKFIEAVGIPTMIASIGESTQFRLVLEERVRRKKLEDLNEEIEPYRADFLKYLYDDNYMPRELAQIAVTLKFMQIDNFIEALKDRSINSQEYPKTPYIPQISEIKNELLKEIDPWNTWTSIFKGKTTNISKNH